jgi:hypothetical protein
MRPTRLALALALVLVASPLAAQSTAPVRFRMHEIGEIRGGYAVAVADFNNDGRLDVVGNSLFVPELAWLENPTWEKHVIASDMPSIVNMAIADIDGDGVPEVALESSFAMQAARSDGLVWLARSEGDPRGKWDVKQIDKFQTSHHIAWADLDGDGTLELINAPLIGPKSVAPTYDQDKASVFWYDQKTWTRHTIDDQIPGIIHRIRPVRWDGGDRQAFLLSSFEGIALYRAEGSGDHMTFKKELLSPGHVEKAPRLGASDARLWTNADGRRVLASVEPWHGNEVVVYTLSDAAWKRRVIFDQLQQGHEIEVVDLNGDGRADIIANDNAVPTQRDPSVVMGGVHVFFSPEDPATGEWTHEQIESEAGMNGCVAGDMNLDGRPDIVCNGASGKIRWYENLGR